MAQSIKDANKKLAELKEKADKEKKDLLYKREFNPQFSGSFTAEVFPVSIMIEALQEVATDSEYAQWAYEATVNGMASGEIQFDVIEWKLLTAYYTTGSFDDNPEIITITRFDQNEEANSDFDIIKDAIGQDYDEILEWAKSAFEKDEDEDDNEFLLRIADNKKFDAKLKELSGQSIAEWKIDYFCEDREIDWDLVFEYYNQSEH